MSCKCTECGYVFEEGEWARWTEPHGEQMIGCPRCKGDFEKMIPCAVCGEEHIEEELDGGVCKSCIDDCTFDEVFKISQNTAKDEVKINSLLATLFDAADIEAILLEHIRERNPEPDCSEWINADREWFGDQLAREVRK